MTMKVRCRKCSTCLRARTNYWGYAAMNQTIQTEKAGLRTWFGTLTFTRDFQQELLMRAIDRHMIEAKTSDVPEWFRDELCDQRFAAVRREVVKEVQRFWKRLRKAGHAFKYFVVIERHKSGLPHVHFLLHEQEARILKRHIQAEWPFGFSNVSIVGGKGRFAAAPQRAAWYVCKYLSKSTQARQLASLGYVPGANRAQRDLPLVNAPSRTVPQSGTPEGVTETARDFEEIEGMEGGGLGAKPPIACDATNATRVDPGEGRTSTKQENATERLTAQEGELEI